MLSSTLPHLRTPTLHLTLRAISTTTTTLSSTTTTTTTTTVAGTPIPGLDYLKDAPAPTLRPLSEYPAWVGELATKPLPTLARLEKMREEDATDAEKMRYLKLTRRGEIKEKNGASAK